MCRLFDCLYRLPVVFRVIQSTHSRKLKLFNILTVYKIKYKKTAWNIACSGLFRCSACGKPRELRERPAEMQRARLCFSA